MAEAPTQQGRLVKRKPLLCAGLQHFRETMYYLPIILGSIRRGRQSSKAARFIETHLRQHGQVETEILDLAEYDLPPMVERVRLRQDSPAGALALGEKLRRADGLVIVTPEYNHSYPGVLKNALDYFGADEYARKPFGFVTVSAGNFGGNMCLVQLQLLALGLGGFPTTAALPISTVQNSFDDEGAPLTERYDKGAAKFVADMVWFTEAIARQKAK